MTLTEKTMDWLNQNRYRSYPMARDEWREKVSSNSGLDCIILDSLVFNTDASGDEDLVLSSVSVSSDETKVYMNYGGVDFDFTLTGGSVGDEGSFETMKMVIPFGEARSASVSMVLSSHAYILDAVGEGKWDFGCKVLKSRVIGVSNGFGVDGILVGGSSCVEGHESESVASGDVVLEDGFRTSPIIHRGKVLVRVGKKFGHNPCHYECGDSYGADCASPLFFFCGQNAINGGNIVIKGGRGISVEQGRKYTVRSGTQAGKTIPCVEIIANSELLDIYKPTV